MCFSSTASFVSGAVISAMGVATFPKVKSRREWPLAFVPIFFGIQQFFEGMVWFNPTANFFAYGFLFFAFFWWPFFFPLVVIFSENSARRRKFLYPLWVVGTGIGIYLGLLLWSQPLEVRELGHSLAYGLDAPPYIYSVIIAYVLTVCGSALCSTRNIIKVFGVALLLSCLAAYWFYTRAFASVWCFFAAALSLILVFYFYRRKR